MANYYTLAPGNYVKFLRGTPEMWESFTDHDKDTLYFICEKNASCGSLYLGNVLISDGSISLNNLDNFEDIEIDHNLLSDNAMLVYDADDGMWRNVPVETVLAGYLKVMVGATATVDGQGGMVPAPLKGQQNLYLRGDATWANPVSDLETRVAAVEQAQAENGLYWVEF